jgi:hypothetical protein
MATDSTHEHRNKSDSRFAGILDVHAHAAPDPAGRRSIDVFELAKLYSDAGFRGFLFMSHFDPTAGIAYLVRKAFPELEIYGGIVLNSLVGGLNPHAVRHFAGLDGGLGKVVYFPTLDCVNEVGGDATRPCVRISENGRLLPDVLKMLDLIAELDLAFSTGHNAPDEILLLIEAGRERGIDRILVTNPHFPSIRMPMDQMVAAAKMGAFLELIYYCIDMPKSTLSMADYAEAVRTIGPEQCILSSCGGQSWMPIHTYAWNQLLDGMVENDISQADIDLMSRENPAKLLTLE